MYNNKDIGKAEGELQPLLKILLIKAIKARTAINIAVITTTQVELPNSSIENSKKALALIKSNGNNISKVNAVNKLNQI